VHQVGQLPRNMVCRSTLVWTRSY